MRDPAQTAGPARLGVTLAITTLLLPIFGTMPAVGSQDREPIIAISSHYIAGDFRGSSLLVDRNGKLFTWGENAFGQLGTQDTNDVELPILNDQLKDLTFRDIEISPDASLALTDDGVIYAFGSNSANTLGIQTIATSAQPYEIPSSYFDSRVIDVELADNAAFAITELGSLYHWGGNIKGFQSLITPEKVNTSLTQAPHDIAGTVGTVIDIEAGGWGEYGNSGAPAVGGFEFLLMLNDQGEIWALGDEAALGGSGDLTNLTQIGAGLNVNFTTISAGEGLHWFAMDDSSNVYGMGSMGKLGTFNGANFVAANPAIGAFGDETYKDGSASLVQLDFDGELGTAIDNGATVVEIRPGQDNSTVIDSDGNFYELKETSSAFSAPFPLTNPATKWSRKFGANEGVPSGTKFVTAFSADYTAAISEDGTIYTWGKDETNLRGNATAAYDDGVADPVDFSNASSVSLLKPAAPEPQTEKPAPPPYTGPIIKGVVAGGSSEFTASGNETATFEGERLGTVTEAYVDEKNAEILDTQEDQFTIEIPQGLNPGVYDLDIRSSSGNLTFLDAITITSAPEPVSYGQADSWTSRISDTQVKVYVKFPTVGEKVRISHQVGGSGSYETVYVKTTSSETMEGLRIVEGVGTYIVRTIDLAEISRIRVTVGDEVMVQVRYNN